MIYIYILSYYIIYIYILHVSTSVTSSRLDTKQFLPSGSKQPLSTVVMSQNGKLRLHWETQLRRPSSQAAKLGRRDFQVFSPESLSNSYSFFSNTVLAYYWHTIGILACQSMTWKRRPSMKSTCSKNKKKYERNNNRHVEAMPVV